MNINLIITKSTTFSNDINDFHYIDIMRDGIKVGSMEIINHINENNDICFVESIDVNEEFRGQGIGTEVLTTCLRNEGYTTIILVPISEDSRRLYERIGKKYINSYDLEIDFSQTDQGYGVYEIRSKAAQK